MTRPGFRPVSLGSGDLAITRRVLRGLTLNASLDCLVCLADYLSKGFPFLEVCVWPMCATLRCRLSRWPPLIIGADCRTSRTLCTADGCSPLTFSYEWTASRCAKLRCDSVHALPVWHCATPQLTSPVLATESRLGFPALPLRDVTLLVPIRHEDLTW